MLVCYLLVQIVKQITIGWNPFRLLDLNYSVISRFRPLQFVDSFEMPPNHLKAVLRRNDVLTYPLGQVQSHPQLPRLLTACHLCFGEVSEVVDLERMIHVVLAVHGSISNQMRPISAHFEAKIASLAYISLHYCLRF